MIAGRRAIILEPETVMGDDKSSRLIIVSGPSGAGKSTVVNRLMKECDLPLAKSVSATTRAPRDAEVDGQDYHFISPEEFKRLQEEDAFLESKEVFGRGHWYGTLRNEVASGLKQGKWVILEIDVQGALAVIGRNEFSPITLFIHPGGMEELERRLRDRGSETEESIMARLETAGSEMRYRHQYQYVIINNSVDVAVSEICQILREQKEKQPCSKS